MPQPLDVLGGLNDSAAYKVPAAVATTGDMTNIMIGLPIIDGYQTKMGDRILVWMNTDQTTNGLYWIPGNQPQQQPSPYYPPPAGCGAWVRAIDMTNTDSTYDGTQVLVTGGDTYAGQIFVCGQTNPIFGVTPITFTISALAAQAETSAAAASASAAAASASAAAAAAAAAGTGGVASLVIAGGTIVLSLAQSNSAILVLSGSLTADQYIDFQPNVTNPRMIVMQGATSNGFTVYLRSNLGADTIGVWFPSTWLPPVSIIVTPSRVYWAGYESKPPGTPVDFYNFNVAGNTPPGHLLMDGSSYATALYDLLFSQIGYTYGGSGANFNVPDRRGYVDACADNLGTMAGSAGRLNNLTVNNTTGESAHTLDINEMPNHNHTTPAAGTALFSGATSVVVNQFASGNTGNTGGGASHNNIQPTSTVARWIRF